MNASLQSDFLDTTIHQTKNKIEVSGWLYQTKTHITHISLFINLFQERRLLTKLPCYPPCIIRVKVNCSTPTPVSKRLGKFVSSHSTECEIQSSDGQKIGRGLQSPTFFVQGSRASSMTLTKNGSRDYGVYFIGKVDISQH